MHVLAFSSAAKSQEVWVVAYSEVLEVAEVVCTSALWTNFVKYTTRLLGMLSSSYFGGKLSSMPNGA